MMAAAGTEPESDGRRGPHALRCAEGAHFHACEAGEGQTGRHARATPAETDKEENRGRFSKRPRSERPVNTSCLSPHVILLAPSMVCFGRLQSMQ